MKKYFIFLFSLLACLLVCSPAFAFTMYETDAEGNTRVLMSVDDDLMNRPTTFAMGELQTEAPHPQVVGLKVKDLDVLLQDQPIPNGASVIFFDFGPDWEDILENSNMEIYGRYCYLFTGKYETARGHVRNGNGGGADKYQYDASSHTLSVAGPYAWVCYNETEDKLYSSTNCYGVTNPYYYTLTLEDVYAVGDVNGHYPFAMCFGDDRAGYISFGDWQLTDKLEAYEWDMDLNSGGNVDTSGETITDFWQFITNGWYLSSENRVVQVFTEAIKGLAGLADLVTWFPTLFNDVVSVLPAPFLEFIKVAFALLVTALGIKFAMHVLR